MLAIVGGVQLFQLLEDEQRVAVDVAADTQDGDTAVLDAQGGEVGARLGDGLFAVRVRYAS